MNDDHLDKAVTLATMALRDIARNDCDYDDEPREHRRRPCPCSSCVARQTLALIEEGPSNWRFIGAHAGRVNDFPRERKIIESWRGYMDDRKLGMILSEADAGGTYQQVEAPSTRDWFVATSVVQWLATNVGMEVLRRAEFEYKGHDKDWKEQQERAKRK
jgi:hypothetical protein